MLCLGAERRVPRLVVVIVGLAAARVAGRRAATAVGTGGAAVLLTDGPAVMTDDGPSAKRRRLPGLVLLAMLPVAQPSRSPK